MAVPFQGKASPVSGEASPFLGKAFPVSGEASPFLGKAFPVSGEGSPFLGKASPVSGKAFPKRLTAFPFLATFGAHPMPPRPPLHPNARRIATPAVRTKILAVIGKRLQPADRDEVMQQVYVRLLLILDELPEGDDDLVGLVGAVTDGRVLDHFRGTAVREARHADESAADDVGEGPDVLSAQEREEWKALHDFANKAVAEGKISPDILRWSKRLAMGDSYEDIARDEGISVEVVKKRMTRAREYLRERWGRATGLTGAVIGAVLLFFYFRHPATPDIVPEAYIPEPTATRAPAVETPEQKVARLTSQAQALCDKKDFDACEALLNDASDIDRDNEYRPPVIKMRHAIKDSTRKH
jgi:DNA-directed RNA polymerase specialized sigma24 family protein